MPTALVLFLRPSAPATVAGFVGRASHAALLTALATRDTPLAQQLHDDGGVKPFAASDLLGASPAPAARAVVPEHTYALRWCSLRADLDAHLLALAQSPPTDLVLDGVPSNVESATVDAAVDAWAHNAAWPDLLALDQIGRAAPPSRFDLQFVTPTTFRSNGRNIPIPLPELVFGSLLDRWNAVAPLPLPPEVRRFAAECLVLSQYRLQTVHVPIYGGGETTFVGRCSFKATNQDRYYLHCCAALLRLAFFSGVGAKASMGFGLVRCDGL